jgi:hypothetical protein
MMLKIFHNTAHVEKYHVETECIVYKKDKEWPT